MPALRLLFLRLAALLARTMREEGDPDRIMLVRPDHLGDLLFVTPALRFLREARPEAHISMLVGPWGQPVLARNPHLDEILVCDYLWFNRRARRSTLEPYLVLQQEAQRLRAGRYGTIVTLRFDFWWGALLAALAGAPRRIGYDLPPVRPFLTEPVAWRPGTHAVWQNLRLAEQAARRSAGSFCPALEFVASPEAEARATDYLAERGVAPDDTLAVIQPGSGAPIKGWTVDGFGEVARHLQQAYRAKIVITGSQGERVLADAIAQRMAAPPIVTAGDTDIDVLAAILRRACLAIGVDSGPLHLAVAVGTPTVHLFGPADPALFGPFGPPERHIVVQGTMPCLPCGQLSRPLPNSGVADCMLAIAPEQVIAAVDRQMDSRV